MNCEDFGQRMHEQLDQRLPLESDGVLWDHAERCGSCRAQMEAWQRIAPLVRCDVSPDLTASDRRRRTTSVVAATAVVGLAAGFLIAFTGIPPAQEPEQPTMVDSSPTQSLALLTQPVPELDPASWWRSVQDRDWVGQTMPTVQSVKEGVAPLGRTLMRAVTILTVGDQDQTS